MQEEKNKLKIPKLEETLQQAKDNASDVEEEEDEKQSSQKSGSFFCFDFRLRCFWVSFEFFYDLN